jgi:hypothetical protein
MSRESARDVALVCNGCGKRLATGEVMVCAACRGPIHKQVDYSYPDDREFLLEVAARIRKGTANEADAKRLERIANKGTK